MIGFIDPTSDLYRTVAALGPCLGVLAVAAWFAVQEFFDNINKL